MNKPLARIALVTCMGFSAIFVAWLGEIAATNQQPKRIVLRKPWPNEPIDIVAVKTKHKAKVEVGIPFDESDDWLDGFTVTVSNTSRKTVTAVTINMIFRREPGDTRPPVAKELHFGPSPIAREYLQRDPAKVIRVAQAAEIKLSPRSYEILAHDFEQTGYTGSISRVELIITEVGFEDGSVFDSGSFYLQDPDSPNDPTKKIPEHGPPRAVERRVTLSGKEK